MTEPVNQRKHMYDSWEILEPENRECPPNCPHCKAAADSLAEPIKMLPLDELVEKSKREDVRAAQKAVREKMKELSEMPNPYVPKEFVSAGIDDKNGWVYDPGQALANLRRAESASDAILRALRQFDYSDRAKDMTEKLIYFGNARTILEDYIAAAKKSV